MTAGIASVWSALSPEGLESVYPSWRDSCLSCASFMRPTRTGAGGRRSVPDPITSHNLGSMRLRSPILSAINRMDPRTHLELGRNLVVD
jgi:hypothetical protein